jgi:tRNA threonylcarbamoyl adenosine modification protein YjeE
MLFDSLNLSQMQHVAKCIAYILQKGDVITLSGEVGSGKTTFARALIGHISTTSVEVTSPTFTLMQSYDVKLKDDSQETLWHLDLYRLKNRTEAEELGMPELWPHVTLIEWPEIINDMLPGNRLNIAFDFGKSRETRTLTISGNKKWQNRLQNINNIQ